MQHVPNLKLSKDPFVVVVVVVVCYLTQSDTESTT